MTTELRLCKCWRRWPVSAELSGLLHRECHSISFGTTCHDTSFYKNATIQKHWYCAISLTTVLLCLCCVRVTVLTQRYTVLPVPPAAYEAWWLCLWSIWHTDMAFCWLLLKKVKILLLGWKLQRYKKPCKRFVTQSWSIFSIHKCDVKIWKHRVLKTFFKGALRFKGAVFTAGCDSCVLRVHQNKPAQVHPQRPLIFSF